jgi:iron complex outermembrane receptor protein
MVADTPTDSVRSVDARTVVVFATSEMSPEFTGTPPPTITSVDDLMRQGSATLITRAAMAGEAMVRGLRGGQVMTSIDGMKVHSACIDKMDPPTAYIELDNLSSLELTAGSSDLRYGANLGGSLAFRMRDPLFDAPLAGSAEVLFDANDLQRRVRVDASSGSDDLAVRAGYTYRAADDFYAGGRQAVDGSRFEKHNAALGLSYAVAEDQSLTLQGIYDLATFIGYPALLMDTRRAEGIIGGLTWKARLDHTTRTQVKLYANYVDHTMDDFDRSIDEVMNRPFMPGMYMPMVGTSFTAGALAEVSHVIGESLLSATLDLSNLWAQATMDMEPLDSTVAPMKMTNIGDAVVGTYGINIAWDQPLSSTIQSRFNARLDVSPRSLQDEQARSVMSGYVPNADFDRVMFAMSLTALFRFSLSDQTTFTTSVSTLERLPTHLESYGFWLYDPQSNFIVIGDPNLKSERSFGADVSYEIRTDASLFTATAFGQVIKDYISTKPYGLNDSVNNVPLRLQSNVGWATLGGIELRGAHTVSELVRLGATVSYTRGYALDQQDDLPLISPLSIQVRAIIGDPTLNGEIRLRYAAAQNDISMFLQPENTTPSWFTADIVGSWSISNHFTLRASVTNLFDVLYHEHTSINDMPSRGRSFMITVRTSW